MCAFMEGNHNTKSMLCIFCLHQALMLCRPERGRNVSNHFPSPCKRDWEKSASAKGRVPSQDPPGVVKMPMLRAGAKCYNLTQQCLTFSGCKLDEQSQVHPKGQIPSWPDTAHGADPVRA